MIDLVEMDIEINLLRTYIYIYIYILQSVSFLSLIHSHFNLAVISDAWVVHLVRTKVIV